MSRQPLDRNYSYEPHDDTALTSSHRPNYLPYRDDSPSRNVPPPAPAGYSYEAYTPPVDDSPAPTPPAHGRNPFSDSNAEIGRARGYSQTGSSQRSITTPGMEHSGYAAGGGMTGQNASSYGSQPHSRALEQGYPPAAAGGAWEGAQHGVPLNVYPAQPVNSDGPYNKRYSSPWDSRVNQNEFNPNDIEDDGDDGLNHLRSQRKSMLPFGKNSSNNLPAGAAAGGAAGAGIAQYNPVAPGMNEKSLKAAEGRRKKKRICFIILGIVLLAAVIAGAILGGIFGSRKSSSKSTNGGALSASEDDGNGDLDKNSKEIKDILGNDDLKMVFPGMDYTPFNAQYPACITNPPSQNNITRDMAVLSQLTKVVRLYGTDCNQTDMVLHAMKQLELDDMKVWMSVWLDKNKTTNARGLRDMYDILDRNGPDKFAGIIIGNEILFREDMTSEQLATVVAGVRANFTDKNIKLPIGVADLGDNWRKDGPEFIKSVDVVMSNIHPFFAGVTADKGAGWTWDFWQGNDVSLTAGTSKQNIISEVGWPSEGGNSCGESTCTSDTQGSIAGIEEMNTFMEDFVCNSLKNGTDFFWFEAFDEPWKVQFNEPGKEWEDRWGLMTPDRKLKPGVKIPDCGGTRIP